MMNNKLLKIEDPLTKRFLWALIGLFAILMLNLIISPEFFEVTLHADGKIRGNLINILNNGARVCILAVGMTLVYATGGIDLSVGSVMAVSGAMAALIIRPGYLAGLPVADPQSPFLLIILLPLLIALLLGLINGLLVAVVKVQPIIATLIMMYSARGLAVLMVQGQTPTYHEVPFTKLGTGFFAGLPVPVWIGATIFVITLIVTKRTAIGIFIESIGENRAASRYVGIRTTIITVFTYIFCAFCAGIAGLIHVAGESSASPYTTGFMIELDAIAAVIIGGTMWGGRFTLTGSLVGALIIQSLTTTVYFQRWPFEYSLVFKALVIIFVALIQSEIFREKVRSLVKSGKKQQRLSDAE
ncbi:MAG: ABC transporter permease [Spirochaetales bacterium]|nr:ABC transporter permease [Spirochaetales bacterium]